MDSPKKKSQISRLKKAPVFNENPFIESSIEKIERNTVQRKRFLNGNNAAEQSIIVNSQGEITGHSVFVQNIEVDEERFTKIYLSQFSAMWELSKPAIRVFGYIMENLLPKKDYIFFEMEEALKYTQYSKPKSVYEGLSNLVELGIIARSTNHVRYFINPLIFFNGDRVTFAKTYVKKRKEHKDNPNQLVIPFESLDTDFQKEKAD